MNKLNSYNKCKSLLILLFLIIVSCNQQDAVDNEAAEEEVVQKQEVESIELVAESSSNNLTEKKSILEETNIEKLSEPCELILGWDPWEPYQYLTPDNQVKGLEIELIQSMAKQIDCQVKFEQGEWMALLEGLKSGKIDMLGGASKTKSREVFAHFSDAYRHESFVLYLLSETKENYIEKS